METSDGGSRMRTRVITVTALLVASASAEAATVQEAFDAATAAYDGERWADAAAAFDALEARLAPHGRSAAIVRVRKGIALTHSVDRTRRRYR